MEAYRSYKYLVHKVTNELVRTVCNCGIQDTDYGWLLTANTTKAKCVVPVFVKDKENYHWVDIKPTVNKNGDVAQLGEHLPCTQGVAGSSPVISTN